MRIFDTHAHYMSTEYRTDVESVLRKLRENGVDKVCEVSATLDDSLHMQGFLSRFNWDGKCYPFLYHSVGIHPDEVKNYEYDSAEFNDFFRKLENCITNIKEDDVESNIYSDNCLCSKGESKLREERTFYKPVGFGEIGLDYYGDKDDDKKLNQKMWFIEQIKLAKKYDLPLIIHSRDACKDTMDIIKEYAKDYHGIIHCFSYEYDIAKEYISMGYVIGVGGVLTYKNGRKLQEVVENIPLEKMVTETDSPYLSPVPKRGERNDSTNISYVIDKICEIKQKDKEEVSEILYNNALKVYNLR